MVPFPTISLFPSLPVSFSVSVLLSPLTLSLAPIPNFFITPSSISFPLPILSVSLFPSVSPPFSLDDCLLLLFPSVAQTPSLFLSSPQPSPASPYPSISPSSLAVLSLHLFLLLSPSLSGYFSLCVSLQLPSATSHCLPQILPSPTSVLSLWVSLSFRFSLSLSVSLPLWICFSSSSASFCHSDPAPQPLPFPPIPLLSEAPPSLSSSPPPPSLLPSSLFQLRTLPSDTKTKLSPHLFSNPDPHILTAQAPSYPQLPSPSLYTPILHTPPHLHPLSTRSDAWVPCCWGRGKQRELGAQRCFWGGCWQQGLDVPPSASES
ncbi:proline-rich protein 36-like [Rattus rattus]|uniref:proline-rich protein 36-like n=1 Tax=Rattus rattus TaxID=10117 RepID=UPI0013F37FFC|nr:proline-rich protein 36-like [Rattus rattus]